MKINIEKWTADRLDVESKIRALKDSIRHGGVRDGVAFNPQTMKYETRLMTYGPGLGTYGDYLALEQLKMRATLLYQIRAQFRGRQHRLKEVEYSSDGLRIESLWTKEREREHVETWFEDYALPEPEMMAAPVGT